MIAGLGILLPNGVVVLDPSWLCVADVMASTHGHGNRVIGELVRVEYGEKVVAA